MSDSPSQLLRCLSVAEVEVLGERVYCEDELGLVWTRVEGLPGEALLARMNVQNETVLRALAMLEEHDETASDAAERAELHRLEGKLNLVLELLAEMVRQREDPPAIRMVRFNARGLCWDSRREIAPGTLLRFDLYVLPAWPVALRLHGRVIHAEARNGGWRLFSQLEGLAPGVRDWLEKLVFRRHRRAVAQQRQRA